MPWYYTKLTVSGGFERSQVKFVGKRILITNLSDLERLQNEVSNGVNKKEIVILLKPEPELLREREFIEEVANVATSNSIPVELEGSILGHAYYILRKNHVQVRCIDPFKEKLPKVKKFGKLVRDNIPDYVKAHGEQVKTLELQKEELMPLIKAKAIEEALEFFWESDSQKSFEELADILEVLRSACGLLGKTMEELVALSDKKRKARGSFEKGIVLLETRPSQPLIRNDLFNESDSFDLGRVKQTNTKINVSPQPKFNDNKITVPLIPPTNLVKENFIFALPDSEMEAVVKYSLKDVSISFRKVEKINTDNQISFDF